METLFKLHVGLDAAGVWSRLPRQYRTLVATAALGTNPIDLVVFELDDSHVVTSEDLDTALVSLGRPSTQLAVIAYDFTEGARAQLNSLGGFIFAEQNVRGWTDKR